MNYGFEPPKDRRSVCYTCTCCGNKILEGEEYWDFRLMDIGVICEDCIDDAHHFDAEKEY